MLEWMGEVQKEGRGMDGWMDGVRKALNDRMDVSQARKRARNRNEWRRMVMQL